MKLSPTTRAAHYKRCLSNIEDSMDNGYMIFLCNELTTLAYRKIKKVPWGVVNCEILELYPEFALFSPNRGRNWVWFGGGINGKFQRSIVMEFCIAMLNSKPNHHV
jgi:hypothetical protein